MKFACFAGEKRSATRRRRDAVQGIIRPMPARDMVDLITRYTEISALLSNADAALPLSSVKLLAPIPSPRRNIFCVGKNYRDHAKEFAGSGYEAGAVKGAEIDEYPAVFTKPASTVVGTGDTVEPASARHLRRRLRGGADAGHRQGRARHPRGPGLRSHLGLHDRQRRDGARPPAQSQAVVHGQGARHLLPDGAVDHDGRRGRSRKISTSNAGSMANCARTPIRAT